MNTRLPLTTRGRKLVIQQQQCLPDRSKFELDHTCTDLRDVIDFACFHHLNIIEIDNTLKFLIFMVMGYQRTECTAAVDMLYHLRECPYNAAHNDICQRYAFFILSIFHLLFNGTRAGQNFFRAITQILKPVLDQHHWPVSYFWCECVESPSVQLYPEFRCQLHDQSGLIARKK